MSVQYPKFIAAAVQAAPVFLDLEATIDKAERLVMEAAAKGAGLVAFPETWMPGYPWYLWLDSPAANMQYVQRYFDNSLVMGSAEQLRLNDMARRFGVYLAMGYSEKSHGSLYMGQCLIGPDGDLIASRRKLKATHVERTLFGEGDGSDLAVHETPLGRVGMLCCWEHINPLNKYAMFSQFEAVHIGAWPSFSLYNDAAHALSHEVNNAASKIYAVEGQCFVVAPCATVSEEMIDLMVDRPDKKDLLKVGGGYAMIYGPDGRELCEPLAPDAEGLVYAGIDLGLISLAKAAADPVGHYSRPDVTRLLFNDQRQRKVEKFRLPIAVVDAEIANTEMVGRDSETE